MASFPSEKMALNQQIKSNRFLDVAEENGRMLAPIQGYKQLPIVSLEKAVDPLVSLVPEVKRMVWTVKENCYSPADSLSSDESASIMLYTLEWLPSEHSFYKILNRTLRAESREKIKPWFLYLKLVLTALSKLPSIRISVYRGVKMNLQKFYPKGRAVVWWGFSSCTSSAEVLQAEQFLGKTGERTMFHIECLSGKDIRQHSIIPSENEILLIPGRQLQVTSYLDSGNGLHFIQMKEVRPPFDLVESPSVVDAKVINVAPEAASHYRKDMALHTSKSLTSHKKKHSNKDAKDKSNHKPTKTDNAAQNAHPPLGWNLAVTGGDHTAAIPSHPPPPSPSPHPFPRPQQLNHTSPARVKAGAILNAGPTPTPQHINYGPAIPNAGPTPIPQHINYGPAIPNAGPTPTPQHMNYGPSIPYYGPMAPVPQEMNYGPSVPYYGSMAPIPQYFTDGFVPAPNYGPVAPVFPMVNVDFGIPFADCGCDG